MPRDTSESVPNTIDGSAAAVFVACGAACLTMGALAALAEMLPGLKGLLAFYAPAGSLSGKAAISVLVFIGVAQSGQIDSVRTFSSIVTLLGWC